ncbi:MYND-type zinc finger-containing protein [Planoprotostelium fungivorum]|uniref:MYND-type zinc finger-containing protein n=1 Tax=Planoprotostelium fungivorum TaxID=1890364 RepID=A0A2P6N9Z4_9EUKA|nr:MYND-type zinc finger-containing protein [Planoprotostelium fungivorum]
MSQSFRFKLQPERQQSSALYGTEMFDGPLVCVRKTPVLRYNTNPRRSILDIMYQGWGAQGQGPAGNGRTDNSGNPFAEETLAPQRSQSNPFLDDEPISHPPQQSPQNSLNSSNGVARADLEPKVIVSPSYKPPSQWGNQNFTHNTLHHNQQHHPIQQPTQSKSLNDIEPRSRSEPSTPKMPNSGNPFLTTTAPSSTPSTPASIKEPTFKPDIRYLGGAVSVKPPEPPGPKRNSHNEELGRILQGSMGGTRPLPSPILKPMPQMADLKSTPPLSDPPPPPIRGTVTLDDTDLLSHRETTAHNPRDSLIRRASDATFDRHHVQPLHHSPSVPNNPVLRRPPPPANKPKITKSVSNAELSTDPHTANCTQCGVPIEYTPNPNKPVKYDSDYNSPQVNLFSLNPQVTSSANNLATEMNSYGRYARNNTELFSSADKTRTEDSTSIRNDSSSYKNDSSSYKNDSSSVTSDNDSHSQNEEFSVEDDPVMDSAGQANSRNRFGGTLRSLGQAAKNTSKTMRTKAAAAAKATSGAASIAAQKAKGAAQKVSSSTAAAAGKASDYFNKKEDGSAPNSAASSATNSPMVSQAPLPSAVFKVSVADAVEKSGYINPNVPDVVTRCIARLEVRGFDEEGIFRISGSLSAIKSLRESIDRGESVDLESTSDEHVVSGLLKLWFRELPEPIFVDNNVDDFCIQNDVDEVRAAVYALPVYNYTILGVLFGLLVKVRQHSEKNKMTVHNLSIVFSATLQCMTETVTFLINEYDRVFDVPNDLLYTSAYYEPSQEE